MKNPFLEECENIIDVKLSSLFKGISAIWQRVNDAANYCVEVYVLYDAGNRSADQIKDNYFQSVIDDDGNCLIGKKYDSYDNLKGRNIPCKNPQAKIRFVCKEYIDRNRCYMTINGLPSELFAIKIYAEDNTGEIISESKIQYVRPSNRIVATVASTGGTCRML